MTAQSVMHAASRRRFLAAAAGAAIAPTAAALLGASTAAASTAALPDYAPIPAEAFGPNVNAQGYFVGRIDDNLFWVTDSFYQAMFLTTRKGLCSSTHHPPSGTTCCGLSQTSHDKTAGQAISAT